MNSLSWLIYLSELVSHLGSFFNTVGFAGLIIVAGVYLTTLINDGVVWKNGKYWILIPIGALFIGSFIPSKQTVMMIAASQYGEKILESRAVKELTDPALDLLKNWIISENEKIKASIEAKFKDKR